MTDHGLPVIESYSYCIDKNNEVLTRVWRVSSWLDSDWRHWAIWSHVSWWVSHEDTYRLGTENRKNIHTHCRTWLLDVWSSLSIPAPFITELISPFLHVWVSWQFDPLEILSLLCHFASLRMTENRSCIASLVKLSSVIDQFLFSELKEGIKGRNLQSHQLVDMRLDSWKTCDACLQILGSQTPAVAVTCPQMPACYPSQSTWSGTEY